MQELPKRLAPRAETIRRLYLLSGNQCAFPGCIHPIIDQNGIYVGELCHICAAEMGGERFDVNQSNEDRRSFENLLLLCHDHHVITNDVEQFPVDRMRQIKSEHENLSQHGINELMANTGVQITDSAVFLGGEGGQSPGAGGGGGGAIGEGAIAGHGGHGGEIVNFVLDEKRLDLLSKAGFSKMDIRVGSGGRENMPGEDSIINLVTDDGIVLESIVAKGGEVNNGPEDCRLLSQRDIDQGVRVTALLLADVIQIRDGLAFMLGGGWERYQCQNMPHETVWPILMTVDLTCLAKDEKIRFTVEVVNPTSSVVSKQDLYFNRTSTSMVFRPSICATLSVMMFQEGLWSVRAMAGSITLATVSIEVLALAKSS